MPAHRRHMDLRGRRPDVGATVKEMAVGLSMSIADVADIEEGTAADDRVSHYAAWLTRMEAWSTGKRERELLAANRQARSTAWPDVVKRAKRDVAPLHSGRYGNKEIASALYARYLRKSNGLNRRARSIARLDCPNQEHERAAAKCKDVGVAPL